MRKKVTSLMVLGVIASVNAFAGVAPCCAKHALEMSAWDGIWYTFKAIYF